MEGGEEVKLHGMWASSFCVRVEMALKLKGVPYEYVEEDLTKKSQLLLQYNPVHKLVPVMLHRGRPICESLIILEYIDDTWKGQPRHPSLLPSDPYLRARVRFWAQFYDQKIVRNSREVLTSRDDEQRKAIAEFRENFKILAEGIEKEFLGSGKRFVNGETPGFLEVVVAASSCWRKVLDEMFGLKHITRESNPVLSSWLDACWDNEVVRSTIPDYHRLVALAVRKRERALGLAP